MSQERNYSSPGETSDPNPFGRGCLPLTVLIGVTLALGGGIGWAVGDWWGLGMGMVLVLAAWVHWIWS